MPFGQHSLSFNHSHNENKIGLEWTKSADFDVQLNLAYGIFADEKIKHVEVNDKTIPFEIKKMNQIRLIRTTIKLTAKKTVISFVGNFLVKELQPEPPLFLGADGK